MWKDIADSVTDQCVDTFSESIEIHYFNTVSSNFEIVLSKAVYDSSYQQIDVQTGAPISSNAPMVEVSLRSLIRRLTSKDKIKARGTLYKVKEVQPDESGAVKIMLARSSGQ